MGASRSSRELLAALAVAVIAFLAPREETGLVLRGVSALLALLLLFAATVGLELLAEWREAATKKQTNRFDVHTTRVDLPTLPPGGVYAAAASMSEHLQGFVVTLDAELKSTESGFQVTAGGSRIRARVAPGHAVGFEMGGPAWDLSLIHI